MGYPWNPGDRLLAADLDAALAARLSLDGGTLNGPLAAPVSTSTATATGSVTSRTLAARFADSVNVRDFGATGDGTTNDTTAIQAAITYAVAQARAIYLPPGTYRVSTLTYSSGLKGIIGAGRQHTTIKRIDNAVSTQYLINVGAVAVVHVSELTLDGNKANNTVDGACVVIIGASQISLRNITATNAKSSGGNFGWGIFIRSNADAAGGTTSTIDNCIVSLNGGHGIDLDVTASYVSVSGCSLIGNTRNGLTATIAAPADGSMSRIRITNNTATNNTQSGIGLSGIIAGWGLSAIKWATISGNTITDNGLYGLAWQGAHGSITNNNIANNGNTSPYTSAGVLLNASYTEFSGNVVNANQTWGVDAGGCQYRSITGNTISDTYSLGAAGAGTGLNLGASMATSVVGNIFVMNGARVGDDGGTNLAIHRYDGGQNYPAIPFPGSDISIIANHFVLPKTGTQQSWGIYADGCPSGVVIKDNVFSGGLEARLIYGGADDILIEGNRWSGALSGSSLASATGALVVPDYADTLLLTGTAHDITDLMTYAQSLNAGKVTGIIVANIGTGFTSTPAVALTGGGGTGATATALLDGAGHVGGFTITNPGSGYTSAPAVGITGGGGSGATATSVVGYPNSAMAGQFASSIHRARRRPSRTARLCFWQQRLTWQ